MTRMTPKLPDTSSAERVSSRNESGFFGNCHGMLMRAERPFPFNHGPARDLVNAKPDPAVSAASAKSLFPPAACAMNQELKELSDRCS